MQVFYQLAIDHHDTLTLGLGLLKCSDDDVCFGNFVVGGCEYLVGGGNYQTGRSDVPIAQQGIQPSEGCSVGSGAWLGANVSILDGAILAEGSIAAAGAVVLKPVASGEIVGGVPARIIGQRDND